MNAPSNSPTPAALAPLITTLRPAAPTHISALLRLMSSEDGFRWFRATTWDLMPDAADAILAHLEYPDMIRAFRQEFEARYLPLEETLLESLTEPDMYEDPCDEPWDSLRHSVPVALHGFIIDDPHEYAEALTGGYIRPGIGLITLLFSADRICPWEPDDAVKLAWIEACAKIVPPSILGRIPLEGFEAAHIAETLRVCGMTDLHNLALWIDNSTPFPLLNYQYHPELIQELDFPWDKALLQDAREQWHEAEVFLRSAMRGAEWLEADPPPRLNRVIDLLNDNYYPWALAQTE